MKSLQVLDVSAMASFVALAFSPPPEARVWVNISSQAVDRATTLAVTQPHEPESSDRGCPQLGLQVAPNTPQCGSVQL